MQTDRQEGRAHCTLHKRFVPTCHWCERADHNLRVALGEFLSQAAKDAIAAVTEDAR